MLKKVYSTKVNALANFTANVWIAVLSIIFVPFYLYYIGVEAYGLIGIFNSIQAFIVLLDFGLSPTLNRELARLSALEKTAQEIHNLKRTLEIPNWISAVVIAFFLSALAPLLANFWIQPKELTLPTITQSLLIISVNIAVQFCINFYIGGLMGLQKQLLLGIINIICGTLRSAGAFIVIAFFSPTIQAFLLWQSLILLLQAILMSVSLNKSLPEPNLRGHFQKDLFRKIWRFAAGMTGISVVSLILTQTDKVILSRMLNLEMFGYYTLAVTISGMAIGMIVSSVSQAAFPQFSKLVSTGNESDLREFYHRSCQILSAILFPVIVILALYSYNILLIWTRNREIAENTYLLLSLVAIGTGLNGLMWLPYFLQLAHGWTRLAFYVNVAAIIVLIPLMIFGVYKYGAIGGALGWVALNTSYIFINIQLMHRKILKGDQWKWYFKDLMPPFFASLCLAGIGKLFLHSDLPLLEMMFGLAIISFMTILFSTFATEATRKLILKFKQKLLRYITSAKEESRFTQS